MTGSGSAGGPTTTLAEARLVLYRERVLDAAEAEFAAEGFAGARVTAIATRAGVSLSTVYRCFAGKEDVWDELNDVRMRELVAAVGRVGDPEARALDRILAAARAQAAFFLSRPDFLALHLRDGLSWGTALVGDSPRRGRQQVAWQAGMQMLTVTAEVAVAERQVRPVRPELLASIVISGLQVFLTDWFNRDPRPSAEQTIDDYVAHLERALAP